MIVLMLRRMKDYWLRDKISLDHVVGDKNKIKSTIEDWPFEMPYMEFRKRLRDISHFSLKNNRFDMVVNWSDRKTIESLPRGTWVVPMDEDDWLDPNFESGIRATQKIFPNEKVFTWQTVRVNPKGQVLHHDFHESCGYAVKLPCDWIKVVNHMEIPATAFHICGQPLAIRNETIASLGFLMRTKEPLWDTLEQSVSFNKHIPKCFENQHKAYRELLLKQRLKR